MEKACALDVHKNSVFAWIFDKQGRKILEKPYGTFTPDLIALRDTFFRGYGNVAMKSTGVYWMAYRAVLEWDFR